MLEVVADDDLQEVKTYSLEHRRQHLRTRHRGAGKDRHNRVPSFSREQELICRLDVRMSNWLSCAAVSCRTAFRHSHEPLHVPRRVCWG